MWYSDNQHRKNWIGVCYWKQIKTSLQESNKNTKYELAI